MKNEKRGCPRPEMSLGVLNRLCRARDEQSVVSILVFVCFCLSFCFSGNNSFGEQTAPQTKPENELPASLREVYRRIQTGSPNTYPTEGPGWKNEKQSFPLAVPDRNDSTGKVDLPGLPPFSFPFPAPDQRTGELLRRGVAFANVDRWTQAIPLLQEFLESDATCFWPDQSAKAMVRYMIASAPVKAQRMYELLYEPSARQALQRALNEQNPELVQKTGTLYALTPSGRTAMFLAARDCYGRGRTLETLAILRQFAKLPFDQTAAMEPELTIMLVSTLVRWGNDEEASARLNEFFRHARQLRLSGTKSFSSPNEVLTFFRERRKTRQGAIEPPLPTPIEKSEARQSHGLTQAAAQDGIDSGKSGNNSQRVPEKVSVNSQSFWLEKLSNDDSSVFHGGRLLDQKMSGRLSPATRPAVHGNEIVVRRRLALELRNAATGKLIWSQQPLESRLPACMAKYYSFDSQVNGDKSLRNIWNTNGPWFAFHDRTSGSVVLDSHCIYGIEFPLRIAELTETVYVSSQKRSWPLVRADLGNTLVARNRVTGEVVWSVGQIPYFEQYLGFVHTQAEEKTPAEQLSEDDFSKQVEALRRTFIGETFFCGPPLLLEGRLYLIGRASGVYSLYILDASNGGVLGKIALTLTAGAPCAIPTPIMSGLTPMALDGLVLCPVPGMLVAVSQGTHEVLWCWHDQKSIPKPTASPSIGLSDLLDSTVNMPGGSGRVWLGACGNRMIYSPQEAPNRLLCMAADSGRVVWEKSFPTLSFVLFSQSDLVIVTGETISQLNPENGRIVAQAVIPKDRFAAGDGIIESGLLFIPLDDGSIAKVSLKAAWPPDESKPGNDDSIAKSVPILKTERIATGLPEGGNIVSSHGRFFITTPECLAGCPKEKLGEKTFVPGTRPAEEIAVFSAIKSNSRISANIGKNRVRYEFDVKPRAGKEPFSSAPSRLSSPQGRELAVSDEQGPCSTHHRFCLNEDETILMIFDEANKPVAEIPIVWNRSDARADDKPTAVKPVNSTRTTDPARSAKSVDTKERHRFLLADEGIFLICDRIGNNRFTICFALRDRYSRLKDRNVRTIHEERRGLEAEWNTWYRELGLNVCMAGSYVAWFDSFGILTTINLLNGKLRRLGGAGSNAKFVRLFAVEDKLFALVLEFQSRWATNSRQSKRLWRLESRSLEDGHLLTAAVLPYTPVFQTGAILFVQNPSDGKFKQINPALWLESQRHEKASPDKTSVTSAGIRDIQLSNDTVIRIVKSEDLALFQRNEGGLLAIDTRNGATVFQTAPGSKIPEGRIVDYELWPDGKDVLVFYRFGGTFPEPGDPAGPLARLAEKPVSRGLLMRYSRDGKEQWADFVSVERTFLFYRQLDMLPCLLFGKSDRSEQGSAWQSVTAIDKQTGEYSFRAKIPIPNVTTTGKVVPPRGMFFVDRTAKALTIALDAEYRFYFKTSDRTETDHETRR